MRVVSPDDVSSITQLLNRAFAPSQYESRLVLGLRAANKRICEWLIGDDLGVAAYVCYSCAYRDAEFIGYHLAPAAVRPDVQRRGLGSRLIAETLPLIGDGQTPVFVLGSPAYYKRFGFRRIDRPDCPFDSKNEHFSAIRWVPLERFTVGYEREFYIA